MRRLSSTPSRAARSFVDSVRLQIQAGRGGNGARSFEARAPGKKTPDGGHGGRGGDVVVKADANVRDLGRDSFHIKGRPGGHGAGKAMSGKAGADTVIRVPLGTCVYKAPPPRKERAADSPRETALLADLSTDEASYVVAEGGLPGRGNVVQAVQSFRFYQPLPEAVMQGKPGALASIVLKLKSIADCGLVGFPNAGKSSLLGALSLAQPKVAAYPFTTLHPHVGFVEYKDGERISVADLPGLVDGAHENRGLGHEFLMHVERTKVLVFVVDVCPGFEGRERSAGDDLRALVHELDLYQQGLSQRPCLVVANKMDSAHALRGLKTLEAAAAGLGPVVPLSAKSGTGVAEFARRLRGLMNDVRGADFLKISK